MPHHYSSRQRCWFAVLGWVGIIYSTLYIVRPICTFLKEAVPFALLVSTLCILLLTALVIILLRRTKGLKPGMYYLLACVLAVYAYGLMTIQYPEEKIHFIEYGILAYLVFRAVRVDCREPSAYWISFVLVLAFGWVDEGIQHILPNRYYQIEDVILNSVSGLLGLLLVYIFKGNNK